MQHKKRSAAFWRSRWRPNERYHCIWCFTGHLSEGNWIRALESIQIDSVSWHSLWSKMPFTSRFRPAISNSSKGCNKYRFFCLFVCLFLIICFIVGVKAVSMAKHFVEDIIQTILEVKAVCLDTDWIIPVQSIVHSWLIISWVCKRCVKMWWQKLYSSSLCTISFWPYFWT